MAAIWCTRCFAIVICIFLTIQFTVIEGFRAKSQGERRGSEASLPVRAPSNRFDLFNVGRSSVTSSTRARGLPSAELDYEAVYTGTIEKETHGWASGRWLERKMAIVYARGQKWIEFHSSSKGPPLFFNICEDDVSIEMTPKKGHGVFTVRVSGQEYSSYVFKVRRRSKTESDVGADYWVQEVNKVIALCGNRREAPEWYERAQSSVGPLQCHAKNLQKSVQQSYNLVEYGRLHGNGTWDADAMTKQVFGIKRATKDAMGVVDALAQNLKTLIDTSGFNFEEEEDCGDSGWDSALFEDVTAENAGEIGLEGKNRFLQSKLDGVNGQLASKTKEIQELKTQLDGLRQTQGTGSAATAAPQQDLPKLTAKQNIDLAMLIKGQLTIDQIRAKLKRGTGFPPTPMPDNEIQDYISALETNLRGPSAPAAPVADLPPLTSKQNIDLAMIKKGQTTIGQITTKLKRGTGFPPQPMPENEIKSYIEAIEAHLNGGASKPAASSLPPLTSKQNVDLAMLLKGQVTLQQLRAKLTRGTGFPPQPMPKDEVEAYVSALEAHVNGGASASSDDGSSSSVAATTTTTTTTRTVKTFSASAGDLLQALEMLMENTSAATRPSSQLNPGAAAAMLDLDRDFYFNKAPLKKKEEKNASETKPVYELSFVGNRGFGWQIQVTGMQKVIDQLQLGNFSEFIERVLAGDPKMVGDLDDTKPDPLVRLAQFMEALDPDELELAANDAMLKLRDVSSSEFGKHFSGISGVSTFLAALSQFQSKNPKNVISCLSDRFLYKEVLDESFANLMSKEEYYKSGHPANLIATLDAAVSDQMTLLYRAMANSQEYENKKIGIQGEWKYVDRNLRNRASAKDAKVMSIPDDRKEAIVPMLYVMNVLIAGNTYTVGKRYQSKDEGKYSPHYMDMFLSFLQDSMGRNGTKRYLTEVNNLCTNTMSFGQFESGTEATGAQLSIVDTTLKNINRCERVASKVAPSLAPDWQRLRTHGEAITRRLESIEESVFEAAGKVSQRLVASDGKPDMKQLRAAVRKFAVEEMMGEDDSTNDKVHVAQSLFDDYSLRTGLYAFCSRLHDQKSSIGHFYAVGNEPAV